MSGRMRVEGNGRPKVSVAVVGVGYWGPNLVRVACDLETATVALACDEDPVVLNAVGRRYPSVELVSDYDAVIGASDVDAVMLATPAPTHYDLARRALEAGKHVFVEKPMAETVEQAERLIALAQETERVLMPGHTFLYSPPVVKIKELIDADELGALHFGTFTRVNASFESQQSVIVDLAAHDFSILRFWLGEPEYVRATGRISGSSGVLDIAFIQVGYADGSIFNLELSWFSPTKLRRTVLVGTKKMALYEDMATDQLRIYDSGASLKAPHGFGEHHLSQRSGDMVAPRLEADEPLRLEVSDFVDAVRTRRLPRSDMHVGLSVVRMIAAAQTSLRCNGAPVYLGAGPDERRQTPDRRMNGLGRSLRTIAG
jgi:predicted dehydrogenase